MTLAITRLDLTAEDLRRAARSSQDVAQACRCLAIASVLDGGTRTAAAGSAGMQRQTLRDWVHRYNAEGVAGLLDRPRPVRPGLLSAAPISLPIRVRLQRPLLRRPTRRQANQSNRL